MSLGKLRYREIIFVKGNQPFFRNRNIQIPTHAVFRPAKLSKADWKVLDKVLKMVRFRYLMRKQEDFMAALPDAPESIPHRDALAVFAAGQVPGFHSGNGGPQGGTGRFAPELPYPQGGAGAVGHGVVLVEVGVGVHLVFVKGGVPVA